MITFAIVPVKQLENSKSRLTSVLTESERMELSILMLKRTLQVLLRTRRLSKIVVVSADSAARKLIQGDNYHRIKFLAENGDHGVNSAVALADKYCQDEGADASIVIPVDLPLITPEEIDSVIESGEKIVKGIIICPSQRQDGTNALFRKPPRVMHTLYDNNSYQEHQKLAGILGIETIVQTPVGIVQDLDNAEDARALVNGPQQVSNPILNFLESKAYLVNE